MTSIAQKNISENPPANAVTAPTVPQDKNADIDRKMRLYGVIEAFRNGHYPSNRQIDETLDYVINHSPIDESKLSKEGRGLIADVREIIATAKQMVAEKNADELFQQFLFHTKSVDYSKASTGDKVVDKDQAKQHGDEALQHLRTLGTLIFTNSEARKLLKDIGILGRDVAADAAAKVSDVARPADHELEQVDEPAPSNQWVGPDGETRDHTQPAPSTGLQEKKEKAQELKAQAEAKKEDVQSQAADHASNVANAADSAQQQQGGEAAADEDRANAAASAGADQAQAEKKKISEKIKGAVPDIPQEHKDRAKEQLERAKGYAKDKFPEERRDRFIYRLKKVLVENQSHRDYQEAVDFFLDKFEHYQGVAKDASKETGNGALGVRDDSNWQRAETELKTLLERFANGQSIQPIFDAVNQLYVDASNDEGLRNWFKKLDAYVRQVLQEPGYVMRDDASKEGRKLVDESKIYFDHKDGKYAGHKERLFDEIQSFFTAYADDPLNVKLGEDVKTLTTDLLYDADGNLTFKSHLWNDLREVIFPALGKAVGYVPVPRVEYTDDQVDLVLENLTLELANLMPNVFEIEARNYFKISPYESIKDQSKHSFWVAFSQIQADLKDISFFVNKKSGFPKIKTSGLADVRISGKGISGRIHVSSTGKKGHAFQVEEVKIKLDKLDFKIRESKFSFLASLVKPLATGLIKKAVAKAIEQAIKDGLVQIDAQLADIRERLDDVNENNEGISKVDALKQSFADKKREAAETKQKAQEKVPDGKFNIAATRDSRILDFEGTDSFTAKQGAAQDAAQKHPEGGWKSPAFDIVPTSSYKAGKIAYGSAPPSGTANPATSGVHPVGAEASIATAPAGAASGQANTTGEQSVPSKPAWVNKADTTAAAGN